MNYSNSGMTVKHGPFELMCDSEVWTIRTQNDNEEWTILTQNDSEA